MTKHRNHSIRWQHFPPLIQTSKTQIIQNYDIRNKQSFKYLKLYIKSSFDIICEVVTVVTWSNQSIIKKEQQEQTMGGITKAEVIVWHAEVIGAHGDEIWTGTWITSPRKMYDSKKFVQRTDCKV